MPGMMPMPGMAGGAFFGAMPGFPFPGMVPGGAAFDPAETPWAMGPGGMPMPPFGGASIPPGMMPGMMPRGMPMFFPGMGDVRTEEDVERIAAALFAREQQHRPRDGLLSAEEFADLPTVTIGEGEATDTACAICLDDFEVGSKAVRTPCGHLFHRGCLEPWATKENPICPTCRKPLRGDEDGGGASPAAAATGPAAPPRPPQPSPPAAAAPAGGGGAGGNGWGAPAPAPAPAPAVPSRLDPAHPDYDEDEALRIALMESMGGGSAAPPPRSSGVSPMAPPSGAAPEPDEATVSALAATMMRHSVRELLQIASRLGIPRPGHSIEKEELARRIARHRLLHEGAAAAAGVASPAMDAGPAEPRYHGVFPPPSTSTPSAGSHAAHRVRLLLPNGERHTRLFGPSALVAEIAAYAAAMMRGRVRYTARGVPMIALVPHARTGMSMADWNRRLGELDCPRVVDVAVRLL